MTKKNLSQERAALVEQHLSIAVKMAKQHYGKHARHGYAFASLDELTAAAYEALVMSAISWNGVGEFGGWAGIHVRWYLEAADRETISGPSMRTDVSRLISKIRKAIAGGAATAQEVSKATNISLAKVRDLWAFSGAQNAVSLSVSWGETQNWSAIDIADTATLPDEQASISDEQARVRQAVAALPADLRAVVEARFGFATGEPMISGEAAAHLGLSVEEFADREAAGMVALRVSLESQKDARTENPSR